jgi:hypothetical protein
MSNTKELDNAFKRYVFLLSICNNALHRSVADARGKFISLINLSLLADKSDNLKGDIKKYFDEIQQKIIDLCFLDIVATFEKGIFCSICNAFGLIKKIVKEGYEKPSPFHMVSESFVKKEEDIYNLSGVKNLVIQKLPGNMAERLSEILEHRNWLAHGKRIGKQSTITIDELHKTLKNILEFVHQ